MSQGSSNPASPSRPALASDPQETVSLVSHTLGLSEVSTSFEVLNIDLERKPNVVHRAQMGYSPGASRAQGSPDVRDSRRSVLTSPHRPKRYALQLWLEVEVGPPDTYTKVKSFVGLIGHYRRFIKGFTHITAPLYDLTSRENKDKKSEHLDLSQEAREAFYCLKAAYLQAPILAFPDFGKPFLLETDASGKGLGAVLLQKQSDGRYHPIAHASRIMTETEQRYHSNKQEFLALKWAVTEQFHEYLSP